MTTDVMETIQVTFPISTEEEREAGFLISDIISRLVESALMSD
jgi:hypothetical protein